MKKNIILIFIFFCTFSANAHEYRNLLQNAINLDPFVLKNFLIMNQKWVPYPEYKDRKSWDTLTVGVKEYLIERGNKALDYEWKIIKATDYLAYDRTGLGEPSRDPFHANNTALADLVKAELAEGQGRFIDQIINGIWHLCELTSWTLAAHIIPMRNDKTSSLPNYNENIIDLSAADLGSFLSWTYYFLKDEMDKVNPLVSIRLRTNIQFRILDPYINYHFHWERYAASPETKINNWTSWCNFNVLNCFLLLENDPDKLVQVVYRTMASVDKFINSYHIDGACNEGPGYWGHAAGKMYEYLQLLSRATNGKVSIFNHPIIKNMGEYIYKVYIGDGWVVNFGDCSPKIAGDIKGTIFNYGKNIDSKEMMQFAAYLYERDNKKLFPELTTRTYNPELDIYRTLESLLIHKEMRKTEPFVPRIPVTWYPETERIYIRNQTGFFFAAKGGFNNESHNHNDMGSFILYLDQTPIIIDPGVGIYDIKTFSSERYSIWTMQSNYHNLPLINGVSQSNGSQYRSENVQFNSQKSIFSLDLAKAYPDEAAVEKWHRSYQLELKRLVIKEKFELKKATIANCLNFMVGGKPDITNSGVIIVKKNDITMKMIYDEKLFDARIETIHLTDRNLCKIWGDRIYRLSLTARKLEQTGEYKFIFTIN